jgi:hypothetical protein
LGVAVPGRDNPSRLLFSVFQKFLPFFPNVDILPRGTLPSRIYRQAERTNLNRVPCTGEYLLASWRPGEINNAVTVSLYCSNAHLGLETDNHPAAQNASLV